MTSPAAPPKESQVPAPAADGTVQNVAELDLQELAERIVQLLKEEARIERERQGQR